MTTYKAEFKIGDTWRGNDLRFATSGEAWAYAQHRATNLGLIFIPNARVSETDDLANAYWNDWHKCTETGDGA